VGKSFVMQAVLKPASANPNAARRPAPPAPLKLGVRTKTNKTRRDDLHDNGIVFMLNQRVFA
jgi:hypothetical protein